MNERSYCAHNFQLDVEKKKSNKNVTHRMTEK